MNVISEYEISDLIKSSETDGNPMLMVVQEKVIYLFSKSSEQEHLSEFEDMISDSGDSKCLP